MRERSVCATDINAEAIKCPSCGSTTISLTGNSQVSRTEDWQNGSLVHTELGKTHIFELEIIECLACMTRSTIKTFDYLALEEQNAQLQNEIVRLTGKDSSALIRSSLLVN